MSIPASPTRCRRRQRLDGTLRRQLARLAAVGFGPLLGLAAEPIQHLLDLQAEMLQPLAIQIGRDDAFPARGCSGPGCMAAGWQTGPNFAARHGRL